MCAVTPIQARAGSGSKVNATWRRSEGVGEALIPAVHAPGAGQDVVLYGPQEIHGVGLSVTHGDRLEEAYTDRIGDEQVDDDQQGDGGHGHLGAAGIYGVRGGGARGASGGGDPAPPQGALPAITTLPPMFFTPIASPSASASAVARWGLSRITRLLPTERTP